MTPAGTSNELDVQNEWEENAHTTHSEKNAVYRDSNSRPNVSEGYQVTSELPGRPVASETDDITLTNRMYGDCSDDMVS